jgi:hypothetical protein
MKFGLLAAVTLLVMVSFLVTGCQSDEPISGGTLPAQTVGCGVVEEIYKNNAANSVNVTVQATDNCGSNSSSSSSFLRVYDEGVLKTSEYDIPDGLTRTVTFSVPAGGNIDIECNGADGNCSYTLAESINVTLPTVTVDCGVVEEIYKNNTANSINVTVQATDNCDSSSSFLRVYDEGVHKTSEYDIPDGLTRTVTFSVPAGGNIDIECNGANGNCSYTLVVH